MIYESDLYFLKTLFFPDIDIVLILDPGNKVKSNLDLDYKYIRSREDFQVIDELKLPFIIINLSGAKISKFPFRQDHITGVISFNRKPEFVGDLLTFQYQAIQNPQNDTLRWIFPQSLEKPYYLDIYDNEVYETLAFRWYSSLIMKFGKPELFADQPLYILRKEDHPVPSLMEFGFEKFCINTSHVLNDAYLTVQMIFKEKDPEYVKIALDKYAMGGIKNELEKIIYLSGHDLKFINIPEAELKKNFLHLWNIPNRKRKGVHKPSSGLVKLLEEMYSLKNEEQTVEAVFKFHRILDKLFLVEKAIKSGDIPRGIHHIHLAKAYKNLVKLLNSFTLDKPIKVGFANRRFHSWNIEALGDEQFFIYRWDKAIDQTPLMYDLFEFVLKMEEDENHPRMENFSEEFDKLMGEKYTVAMMEKYGINLELYFKLFVIIRFTDELFNLMEKPILPYQSNFKVLFWNDVLQNI